MQISRHWRLNAQRYRLEGYRNTNGELSLQRRPTLQSEEKFDPEETKPAIPTPAVVAKV